MKRSLSIVLILIMVSACANAEIDLSSLSFDELRDLQARISIELTTRPEWKEVPVPPGLYQVGVDIPAGDWCLKFGSSNHDAVHISYGTTLNESGSKVDPPWEWYGSVWSSGDDSHIEFVNMKMIDGFYVEISDGTIIFTTPIKTTLGF